MTATEQTNTEVFQALWDAPMSHRGFLTFDRNGVASIGMSGHGKLTVVGFNTVPGLGLVATLHEEGGKHWSGRGERASHPASTAALLLQPNGERSFKFVYLSAPVEKMNAEARAAKTAQFLAHTATAEVTPGS